LLRLFFVLSLSLSLFANDFRTVKKVSLQKDEFVQIYISYGKQKKLFKLRWTLFVNGGLVIHKSYSRTVSQNILYLNHTNQSLRQELQPKGSSYYNIPYLLIKFKKFDTQKNEAVFEIYLSDDNRKISMKYVERRR